MFHRRSKAFAPVTGSLDSVIPPPDPFIPFGRVVTGPSIPSKTLPTRSAELRVVVGTTAKRSKLLSIFFTAFSSKLLEASDLDVIYTIVVVSCSSMFSRIRM